MEKKMSDLIPSLANSIALRKQSKLDPYVLLIGAGASISSGCSSTIEIVDDTLNLRTPKEYEEWQEKINAAIDIDSHYGELAKKEIDARKRERFFEMWGTLDANTRYSILRKHLWENKQLSDAYLNLANLIRLGYFKIVLTTNLDNLLERALREVGLIDAEDFIILVNGRDKPEVIREQLDSSQDVVKIVKLHGSIETPISYAFTPEEIFEFESNLKPTLTHIINQSLIIIGHSMHDRDIDTIFEEEGKEIHFVGPSRPEIGSRIDSILKVRRQGSIINGDEGKFDTFIKNLKYNIEKEESSKDPSKVIRSIEGFLRSIGYENELKVSRSRFKNLPGLYVKPTEYEDILRKLEEDHIIFIIGEPHLGKTYTAFYLLWEYYQKGYNVTHIRHDRLVSLLYQYEGDMQKLLLNLFSDEHCAAKVIHFDDPFGETMERRVDIFAKELDKFLEFTRKYEHLRVIVTTRLNIFREALIRSNPSANISNLEKDLRVHTSYQRNILLEILYRYIHFYRPSWANDPKILSVINDKLPDLLPAPHNIEFFVRTSERLTSLEEVLDHIDSSKVMIKALGDWMEKMPDHEQIFLLWLEICSASEILFPDRSASHMSLEEVYNSTLGFLFVKKLISGIPPNSFYNALDKFNMIIIENKDGNSMIRYNFVHPSYHEALWYANQKVGNLFRWWSVIKENIADVTREIENNIDLVQLRIIERYGTMNRDLNALLLISAESPDVFEQIIALEHMLERIDEYVEYPQFFHCIRSIIASRRKEHKIQLLIMIDKYLSKLPPDALINVADLIFDPDEDISSRAIRLIIEDNKMPESVSNCISLRTWRILGDIINSFHISTINARDAIRYLYILRDYINKDQIVDTFSRIPLDGIKLLFQIKNSDHIKGIIFMIIESYNKVNKDYKDLFVSFLSNKEINKVYVEYIEALARQKRSIPAEKLKIILSIPGEGRYRFLPIVLAKSKNYSKKSRKILNDLISNSPDLWVAASIGHLTKTEYEYDVDDWIDKSLRLIISYKDKKFLGALLAEMAQNFFDEEIGMQFKLLPILQTLAKDGEIVDNAEYWMEYQLHEFEYFDDSYWSRLKNKLNKLFVVDS